MSLVIKTNFSKLQMYMIRKINREKERGIKSQKKYDTDSIIRLLKYKKIKHVRYV